MSEYSRRTQNVVARLDNSRALSHPENKSPALVEPDSGISRMAMPRRWTQAELRQKKLVYPAMPERKMLNAFRQLRTQLVQKNAPGNLCIMVTSVGEGEDSAALNAINLAAAFALNPHKTALYLDCNPSRPSGHKYMLEKPELGVTDYLDRPDIPLEKIIYPSGLDRLRVIPAGSAAVSAAEQVHSSRMQALIEELNQRYADRYIIVNAPSVTAASEAAILAEYCNTTLLVVPYGEASAADIETAYQAIDKTRLAGMIYSYL